MPPSRSRSPPSVQARGCAQPVVSPASNPVTSRPQKLRAAGRRSVVQTPNVPVFVNSGASVPVGQFDPALRLPGAPLQTPPRHLQGNMVAHPRDPNDVAAESALRSKFPEGGVDPGSSEKTTAASAWVMNVAAAWNLSPDAPRKTECPVSAVPMPSDQQQRAAQMAASSVAAPVEQPDDASDDDAALLAACVSLEKKIMLPVLWRPVRKQNRAWRGLQPRCQDGLGKPMRVGTTSNACRLVFAAPWNLMCSTACPWQSP